MCLFAIFSTLWSCGRPKSDVELLLEMASKSSDGRNEEAYTKLNRLGAWAVPEFLRIASDASYSESIRSLAVMRLSTEPSAVPTLVALLDDSSDTIRAMASFILHGCIGLGFYNPGSDQAPKYISRYKKWWGKNSDSYLEELKKIHRKAKLQGGFDTSYIDFSQDFEKDVAPLFHEFAGGRFSTTDMEPFLRLKHLGPRAIPQLKKLAMDTSITYHSRAFIMLGHIGDTSIIPFMCDSLKWVELLKSESIDYENTRSGISHGLDKLLKLGSFNPGDPNKEEVVDRYKRCCSKRLRGGCGSRPSRPFAASESVRHGLTTPYA